jgi:uncharacterized protein involved in propanediol utilization
MTDSQKKKKQEQAIDNARKYTKLTSLIETDIYKDLNNLKGEVASLRLVMSQSTAERVKIDKMHLVARLLIGVANILVLLVIAVLVYNIYGQQ